MDEVGVPVEEDQHLLHQVCDANVQLPEGEGRGVVLATVQDGAALATPARDEVVRDVGSTILSETVLSSAHSSVANLASCSQFLVQKHSMTLTEQVLLHRDAQLLGMQVISESSTLDQNAGVLAQTSASARPGELGGEFRKLFNFKQSPLFNVTCGSSIVQKPLVTSTVSFASPRFSMLVTITLPRSSSMDSAVCGFFRMFRKPLCWFLGM